MTDASGSTIYRRDPLGRILQKTQTVADNPGNPSVYRVVYQYHPGGAVAQITYPSGLKVFYRKTTSGQISQIDVQVPGNNKPVTPFVTGLAYTALNQPKTWDWNSGDTARRSFDADARMTHNEFASYGYDAASRITGITQNLWAQGSTIDPATGTARSSTYPTPVTWSASYDNRNRLTTFARDSVTTTYTYDANGNRLSAVAKTTSDTDLDGDFDQADFSKTTRQNLSIDTGSNRLLGFTQTLTSIKGNQTVSSSTSQITYRLDQSGNLTSDGLGSFEYDAANRLSKVQVTHYGQAAKVSYLHNTVGQRVFKSEPQSAQTAQIAPNPSALGQGFVTWLKSNFAWLYAPAQRNATLGQSYVYDDANLGATPNLLGEYGNGGAKSAGRIEYIWLPMQDGPSIPIGLFKGNRFFAIHADHIHTPRLITDDSNKVVWQWPYSAFGNNQPSGILKTTPNPKAALTQDPQRKVLLKRTSPALQVNLRYPGQYFDEESNLNYNYFRSYQAAQGRYTQVDPIGLAGGLNRFTYADANPINSVDPMGLATYQCTRRLNNVPFRAGPLYHQFICTGNTKDGHSCGGLVPSGNPLNSAGKIEPDQFKPDQCQKVEDDNACVERCVAKQFVSSLPNYSVNLKYGDNCQTFANQVESSCRAMCRGR